MDRAREYALVRLARGGDEEAVETLIRAHQDALYAFILRLSGRPDTAEDVVQEALVRVLRNLGRFDDRYRFSTWLFTIARRLYINASRKHGPVYDNDSVSGRAAGEAALRPAPERVEAMTNARRLLDRALGALPAHQREIIFLHHHQNRPIAEIAGLLSLPLGTVKSHLHRGRKRMQRMIMDDRRMHRQAQEVWS